MTVKIERNNKMVELRRDGNTFQSIGDTFGVTRERVRKIVYRIDPSLIKPVKISIKYRLISGEIKGQCPNCKSLNITYKNAFIRIRWEKRLRKRWVCSDCGWRTANPIPVVTE